jgi:GT2 family glycosyltransferase
MRPEATAAIVIPVGPGKGSIIDTIESVVHYCSEDHILVLVDDRTEDGTFEALLKAKQDNWRILRNPKRMGVLRLVHTLCNGFSYVLKETKCDLILRMDQDALMIGPDVLSDARRFVARNQEVGIFGVYENDYDRPRSFVSHRRLIEKEMLWWRKAIGVRPWWSPYLEIARAKGYEDGENVFGGAYFVTRECLQGIQRVGGMDVPNRWHSKLMEDVFFSMLAVAAGFKLGHFAAPDGPLALEWRGLPYPATELARSHFKIVHSVDKGKNTGPEDNNGETARQYFRRKRQSA